MKLIPLTKDNLDDIIKIQHAIFPTHDASQNYKDAVAGVTDYQYFLLYDEKVGYLGITGIYSLQADPESAWLGWFGILKEYRRNHYGSEAMRLFEEYSKNLGYKYCRLYTDRYDNEATIMFYEANGYTLEPYENPLDPACFDFPVLIGTKCLYDSSKAKWNNRNMEFTTQIFKQTGFIPVKLLPENLDEVTALYEACFLDNEYFIEQFKGQDLKQIMDTSFKDMFAYCIQSGYSYGIFENNKLVGISLCFDFYELKQKDPRQFNNVFTSDYDCTNYPYQHEFHDKVAALDKPIYYIMAIAVNKCMRGKGIARVLVNNIILSYSNYTIMSDVTSKTLLKIFKSKQFDVTDIDDGYYMVSKRFENR